MVCGWRAAYRYQFDGGDFMNITQNRLGAPSELPEVQATKAQAVEFFKGWWAGLCVGFVIGAAVGVLV